MLRLMFCAFMALLTVSCGSPHYVDYFPYHDDGTPKPKVALLPIKNSCQCDLPWNISEELSEALYYQLMSSGALYAMSPEEMAPGWSRRGAIDFFGNDLSFGYEFGNADFVIAMELIEHSLLPCHQSSLASRSSPDFHPYNRIMGMRVRARVIDMRGEKPRLALYEVVNSSYTLGSSYDSADYEKMDWRTSAFLSTPCGIVHQRMVNNLASRLEQVIGTSRY